MILADNSPANLRICIGEFVDTVNGTCQASSNTTPRLPRAGDVWLTPALRGSLAGTDIVCMLLDHLFGLNYRRVEWIADVSDIYARTLASKSGFTLEAILRKHMVIRDRSRDTALYSVTNSEWCLIERNLKSKLSRAEAKAKAE